MGKRSILRVMVIFALIAMIAFSGLSLAQEITATVTDLSGNIVKLTKVNTVQLSFHVGDSDMGIPIIQIRNIKSLGRGDMFKVTLVSGEILEGSSRSKIEGEWELGAYSLELSKAKSIVFEIGKTTTSEAPEWKQPAGFVAQVNGTNVYGLEYEFSYTGFNRYWIPAKSYTVDKSYLWLPVVKGPALYFIPFSKIKQVSPNEVILTDDFKVEAYLYLEKGAAFEGRDRKLKGETTFGSIEFAIEKVKSIIFIHEKDLQISSAEEEKKWNHKKFESDTRLKGTIFVDKGTPINVSQLDVFSVNTEGYTYSKSKALEVYIGDALNKIDLSKLAAIKEFSAKRSKYGVIKELIAKIVTKSGNLLSVKFKDKNICFGGKLDLGYVKVFAADVKAVELKEVLK